MDNDSKPLSAADWFNEGLKCFNKTDGIEVTTILTQGAIYPDDLKFSQETFELLLNKPNKPITVELRFKCRDGQFKWIQFTGINLFHDPDIKGILGNYHDISEKKQTDQALRESKIRFKALHNASFGGIAIHKNGIILECNDGLSDNGVLPSRVKGNEWVAVDGRGIQKKSNGKYYVRVRKTL